MSKELHCRDLGFDCEAVIRADSEDEILAQAAEHARPVHNVDEISPELVASVRAAIRER
jgi:predicted small metal-binding protein